MKISKILFLSPLLLALIGAQPAVARDHHWRGDIHRFHDHDFDIWVAGRWIHGLHGGRAGWWWVTGDSWYFYSRPIYPYPDPYRPSVIVLQQQAPSPPPVVIQAAPPRVRAKQYWYYCSDPSGYYPYVQTCQVKWKKVSTTPEDVSPAAEKSASPPPPPPVKPESWYHCTDPEGYYPYVPECNGKWEKVPVDAGGSPPPTP